MYAIPRCVSLRCASVASTDSRTSRWSWSARRATRERARGDTTRSHGLVRLFVAINLPESVRTMVHEASTPLRDAAAWVAWTPPHKLHLTMKFIGERDEATVPALAEELADTARRHSPILLAMGGIGAFPNFRRPHVVWMGVEPHPRLELLHHDVELACERQGIEVEGRPFRPHLTLGRIGRSGRRPTPEALRTLARARRAVDFRTGISVDSVDLMCSDLRADGARHTLVAAAPLRGA